MSYDEIKARLKAEAIKRGIEFINRANRCSISAASFLSSCGRVQTAVEAVAQAGNPGWAAYCLEHSLLIATMTKPEYIAKMSVFSSDKDSMERARAAYNDAMDRCIEYGAALKAELAVEAPASLPAPTPKTTLAQPELVPARASPSGPASVSATDAVCQVTSVLDSKATAAAAASYPALPDATVPPCAPTLSPVPSAPPAYPSLARASSPAAGSWPPLRPLHLPTELVRRFAVLAAANNVKPPRGIETCGILAGREIAGGKALAVTHLLVPRQRGGPDACEMEREDEVLAACLREGLMVLGWVHTHPSQTCFLSSPDLHTHATYQGMLPEAVALVLAPGDAASPVAALRLTPSGLALVQACSASGHHPHDSDAALFEHGTHVQWVDASPLAAEDAGSVVVVDFRLAPDS